MTELKFVRHAIPCADLRGESDLPAWNKAARPTRFSSELDEDDGLFLNYGGVPCAYPYREQCLYDHDLQDREMLWAVLENEYLRAVFAPEVGGKLWSLYDKKTEKELLFANPVNKPCNLAIRNAWTSGGVEWNCGFLGHHPHTCDTMFTARLQDADGTPVLRMYEFERVRGMTYQMDFSLPAGSPVLYCRMRIVNPNDTVTPIYWWSNMAVPEVKGGRVIIPAHATYTNISSTVIKVPIPVPDYSKIKVELPKTAGAFDVTYPTNTPVSIDYFWTLDKTDRPFTCQLDQDGYGMFQASTARLKGRKLFVWGQGPGGNRWQEFLSGAGCDGHYVEIQAGLAASQYETLPMPPHTAWEWVEIYGAMQADPARVHGDWDGAIAEVNARLDGFASAEALERRLQETHALALTPATELICTGSGWGALENQRLAAAGREIPCPHLDFGAPGAAQAPWQTLLQEGRLPAGDAACPPPSWMKGEGWEALLRAAAEQDGNWHALCQLGGMRFAEGDTAAARALFERSLAATPNAWALYGISCCVRLDGDKDGAADWALKAHAALPDHAMLALHAAQTLYTAARWQDLLALEKTLAPQALALPRIQLMLATACVHTGDLARAEAMLWADGGLVVPDVQEGEVSVTELWMILEEAKAAREGRTFDRESAEVPHIFDFRMFKAKKKA